MDAVTRPAPSDATYAPRDLSRHGVWSIRALRVKLYGIATADQGITQADFGTARTFIRDDVLAKLKATGSDASLGFAIIHRGTEGVTLAVHWWEEGSILCHAVHRQRFDGRPSDVQDRGTIGCVWELAVIDAETRAWRDTMMTPRPSPEIYLKTVLAASQV
ncbi:hypothetical protein JANAI61_11530 [Jannaschia sp. AI_61]|nr:MULTISPECIES: hypothetical protein [unclassified Jannaschia]GIT90695.1 hypothetical protein JANAI61_11530 [Jannaschia sp. AI_61]